MITSQPTEGHITIIRKLRKTTTQVRIITSQPTKGHIIDHPREIGDMIEPMRSSLPTTTDQVSQMIDLHSKESQAFLTLVEAITKDQDSINITTGIQTMISNSKKVRLLAL